MSRDFGHRSRWIPGSSPFDEQLNLVACPHLQRMGNAVCYLVPTLGNVWLRPLAISSPVVSRPYLTGTPLGSPEVATLCGSCTSPGFGHSSLHESSEPVTQRDCCQWRMLSCDELQWLPAGWSCGHETCQQRLRLGWCQPVCS